MQQIGAKHGMTTRADLESIHSLQEEPKPEGKGTDEIKSNEISADQNPWNRGGRQAGAPQARPVKTQ